MQSHSGAFSNCCDMLCVSECIVVIRDGNGPGGARAGPGPGLKIHARGPYGSKRALNILFKSTLSMENSNFC